MKWWEQINRFLTPQRVRYAGPLGGVVWVAWLLSILLGAGARDSVGQVVGADYLQFYAAGSTLLRGESAKLYDLEYQQALEEAVAGGVLEGHHWFLNPPFFAAPFALLAMLPYEWSFFAWSVVSVSALVAGLRLLGEAQPYRRAFWSLAFFPVFAAISFGQNSLISFAILCLTYFLWRRREVFAAGLVCSVALYKPQLIMGVVLLWLLDWRRDWKALCGLVLGATGLACVSFLLMPAASEKYVEFACSALPRMMAHDGFPIWHAASLRSFFFMLLPGAIFLGECLGLLISAGALVLFVKLWSQQHDKPALTFSAAICLTLLVTPHAMIYEWSLLLIPALLLWSALPELRPLWRALFAVLWLSACVSGPIAYGMQRHMPLALQVGVAAFVLVLLAARRALHGEATRDIR